jgi:hypothetical protein
MGKGRKPILAAKEAFKVEPASIAGSKVSSKILIPWINAQRNKAPGVAIECKALSEHGPEVEGQVVDGAAGMDSSRCVYQAKEFHLIRAK